jgi:hypothetical protein
MPSVTFRRLDKTRIDTKLRAGRMVFDSRQRIIAVATIPAVGRVQPSDVRWKIFHRKLSRTENFPQYFSRKFSVS